MTATKGAMQAAGNPATNAPVVPMDPIKAATMEMENMEKDGLRNEIRNLQKIIKEKEEKTRALEVQCRDLSTAGVNNADTDVAKIRGEFEAHLATKEQELDTWRTKVAELNENTFINQDNIRKLTEMTMQQTDDMSKQMKTIMDLKKQIKVLQANHNVPQLDASEVGALRSHLTEVEESLKQTNQALDEKTNQNKVLFMKMKKAEEDMEALRTELEFSKQKLAAKEREANLPKLPQITIPPLGNAKPQSEAAQAKVLELEAQVRKLQSDLAQAKISTGGPQIPASDLELQYKTVQSELIDAKKTIKIQRREIENLQKLAGL
jgi:chromosome segregation ATPase